jgi:hypothetical protein
MNEVVKGTGHDWNVHYTFADEEPEVMTVFGAMTVERAISEARYSLDGINGMNKGTYEITKVERS